MENWTIAPLGIYSTSATRTFGPYTVIVVQGPQGGSWRIGVGGTEIARHTAPLPTKSIDEAIGTATAQISALVDALAPFSALAAELAEAEDALDRQEMQIAYLEGLRIGYEISLECAQSRYDDALDARHAEAAHADDVVASTRALLTEAEAALARQEARIVELEAKADVDADAATIAHLEAYLSRADKRLARYVRRDEMCVWGPEDAEEGGQ